MLHVALLKKVQRIICQPTLYDIREGTISSMSLIAFSMLNFEIQLTLKHVVQSTTMLANVRFHNP